jgi:Domain of unknown function (DUF4271)
MKKRVKQILPAFFLLSFFSVLLQAQEAAVNNTPVAAIRPEGPWPLVSWVAADAPESHAGRWRLHENSNWKIIMAVVLLLVLGILRRVFEKYFNDLLGLMFRSTVKYRQIREQMQNKPLQSLAFNLFFAISGGAFLFLLSGYYGAWQYTNQGLFLLLCTGALAAVYLVKFLALKFFGWLFNSTEITNTYIFIVFYINKILGILLAPAVVILLLANAQLSGILFIILLFVLAMFFLYRYVLIYSPAWKAIQMPAFHFFLYICAVEIAPLLLIYKVLFDFTDNKL